MKKTGQMSFSDAEMSLKKKQTRREQFLSQLDTLVPWSDLLALIVPHYAKSGRRGRPTGLGLADDIAANGLTVTGHSLGGHLAMAFTRLFPETGASALTVNGAGYPTGTTSMLSGRASNNFLNRFPTLGEASNFGADHARSPKHFYQYGLMAPFSLARSAY